MKPVISYAEKMGVIFAIEPVWKHIVCNPKRARKVLDEIASPNLQIIFDPVNLLDISNYQNRDVIIEEAIELLGDDIAMVHMKDFVVQDGKLVSVAAGTGEMNYEKIIRFIKERKPYIHVTLENQRRRMQYSLKNIFRDCMIRAGFKRSFLEKIRLGRK